MLLIPDKSQIVPTLKWLCLKRRLNSLPHFARLAVSYLELASRFSLLGVSYLVYE